MTLLAEIPRLAVPTMEIVRAASLAPSPDNNQPWFFEAARGGELRIHIDRERSLPSDVGSMFDLIAIGAAIENACLAALRQGFVPQVEYLVEDQIDNSSGPRLPIAAMSFSPGGSPDPLFRAISERCTCRRPYQATPIDSPAQAELSAVTAETAGVQIDWVAGRPALKRLGRLVAAADSIRFQHRPFHAELYRQLRYTRQEAERTRDGLDVRTFELPPGAVTVLKWLRSWPRMQWWQRLGLGSLLSNPSARLVRRSGAVAVFSTENSTPSSFLDAGRTIQRFWLTATALGLSVHPLGSLPIFFAHAAKTDGRSLPPSHSKPIVALRHSFTELVPKTSRRTPALLLRVGHSGPPTVRSLRRDPESLLER